MNCSKASNRLLGLIGLLLVLVADSGSGRAESHGVPSIAAPDSLFDAGASANSTAPGMNNVVKALAVDARGHLYAGGAFTSVEGVPAAHVAEWDGRRWTSLGTGLDGTVFSLACDRDGNLYAGGLFTVAGGTGARFIARWDGRAWSPEPTARSRRSR